MSTEPSTPGRDRSLDGLRGLAALAVLFHHVGVADIAGVSSPAWLVWPADSRAAVMVFFVLSGFVIGLTYPQSAEPKDARDYLWRRLVWLMPINLVAVLLACAVVGHIDFSSGLANVFFLQNFTSYAGFRIPVIEANENLWSLNYEVLYYLLFVLIWRWNPALRHLGGATLVAAVLGWYTSLLPLFVACYAAGFLFWGSGLALAWHAQPAARENANWPSCLLLLLVTCKLRGLLNVLAGFPIPLFDGPVVMLYYLDFLPVSIWLVAIVTRRTLPGEKAVKMISVLLPVVGLAIKWRHPGYFTPLDYRLALGTYILALLLWRWRPSLQFFRLAAPVGSIAFALYAISRPIQTYLFGHAEWFTLDYRGYIACALLTVAVAVVASWLLEQVVQPRLTRWLAPRRRAGGR